MAVKETGNSLAELVSVLCKLIKEHTIDDAALLNVRHMKSLATFNSVDEILEYAKTTYCDSIIIKKRGRKMYTEEIKLTNRFYGYKLNERSITLYYNPCGPNIASSGHSINIRF